MKRITSIFPFALLLLAFPLSAFANAGWPTLLIAVSPVIMWYIGIVSILIETAVLWYFLRPSIGNAVLMSLIANVVSLVVGFLLGGMGVGYLGQTSIGSIPALVAVFGSWHASLIFMFLLTVAVELGVLKICWKYIWRRLWLPVVLMNILSYLLIEVQFLWGNGFFG